MEELLTTEQLVKETLEKYPNTRENDSLLYLIVGKTLNPHLGEIPYEKVMLESNSMGLPKYETVTRIRRKLQEKHENLRASKKVIEKRYSRWKVFRDYAVQDKV